MGLLLSAVILILGCQGNSAKPSISYIPAVSSQTADAGLACHPYLQNGLVRLGTDISPAWSLANNGGERLAFPDAPARAYQLGKQVCVHITHYVNSRVCGSSLTDLNHPGQIILRSPEKKGFPLFDYHNWLFSPYVLKDHSLIALAHSEWYDCLSHSTDSPMGCSRKNNQVNSWANAITAYQSNDNGASWQRTGIVASPSNYPKRFESIWPEKMVNFGFFHPSNIIREGSRYYVFARYTNRNPDTAIPKNYGIVLISTTDPHSAKWEQVNPQGHFVWQAHNGLVLPGTSSWDHVSVTWNEALCQYLLLFWDAGKQRYMSTTTNSLAHPVFSEPQEVQNQALLKVPGNDKIGLTAANYATAQLDPDSQSPNFETTDNQFWIFLSSFTSKNVTDRNLYRVNAKLVEAVNASASTVAKTAFLPKGIFKSQSLFFYSNGLGHYCSFRSSSDVEKQTKQKLATIKLVDNIPSAMVLDGVCGG